MFLETYVSSVENCLCRESIQAISTKEGFIDVVRLELDFEGNKANKEIFLNEKLIVHKVTQCIGINLTLFGHPSANGKAVESHVL